MVNANGRSSTEEKLDFQEKQTVSKKVNIWVKKKSFNTGGGGTKSEAKNDHCIIELTTHEDINVHHPYHKGWVE